jgi:hypothetical protein
MLRRALSVSLLALALSLAPGCASTPDAPNAQLASKYLGRWESLSEGASGIDVSVSQEPDGRFVLRSNRSGKDRESQGGLIDAEGTMMCRIKVFTPAPEQAANAAVPLYHFGVLPIGGDRLLNTPIRPDWLESTIAQHGLGRYIRTTDLAPGTGVAVATDWDAMEHILRDAVTQDGALGPTEEFSHAK